MSSQHFVIVGGSSGIGLATAQLLLVKGHKVTITGRSADRLERARNALTGDLHVVIMDAADSTGLPGAFGSIGQFDHLVLALGSGKGAGPFASVPLADVKAGFEEKVYAHFGCAQAALPYLRKDGSLTLISAVTAHAAMPGTAGIGEPPTLLSRRWRRSWPSNSGRYGSTRSRPASLIRLGGTS